MTVALQISLPLDELEISAVDNFKTATNRIINVERDILALLASNSGMLLLVAIGKRSI